MRIKNLNIGIPIEYYNEHLSDEVYDAWNMVARILKENGADIKQVCRINSKWETPLFFCFF